MIPSFHDRAKRGLAARDDPNSRRTAVLSRYTLRTPTGLTRLLAIEDRIFTEWRVEFYGFGIIVAYVLILGWLQFLGIWVIHPDGTVATNGFCWIWLSGVFAASEHSALVYDYSIFSEAHDLYFRPDECRVFWFFAYPPTFLFFTYFFGLMPFLLGYAAWIAATLIAYQAAVYAIVSRRAACIAAIAPGPVIVNIVNGHTGFLTAALVGLSLVFIERRPWVSGIFLGLLTYKPHFGVLFPLALLASRNWRALGSAAAMSAALAILAAIAFGHQGWQFFFEFLANRNAGLSTNQGFEILYLQSVFALLHWMGIDLWITWTAHLLVAGAVALAVWFVWAKPFPFALRAAVLCIGSVMVTPYVLAYDLCILSIAAAFLVSDGLSRGFLPGERTGMVICWALLFPVWTLLAPIGPFVYFSLLLLAARRTAAHLKGALPQGLEPFRSSEARPALGTAAVR